MITSQIVQVGNRKLLPVKEVVEGVPYSRDYITRLARESKIVAVQIDRQWLVDPESVRSFYEHSKVEEQTRSMQLRRERKRELEVKDFLAQHDSLFQKRHARMHRSSLAVAGLVVLLGSMVGLGLHATISVVGVNRVIQLAQLPFETKNFEIAKPAAVQDSFTTEVPAVVYDYGVVEEDVSIDVSNGFLLLPATTSTDVQISEMFSDPLEVVSVGSSTGLVRLGDGSEVVVPFIQVPVSLNQDANTGHTTL